ncbi:hypothetical protein V496_00998 [Pseudogymnoascus sp. VKM F-4515 (FW-2607)]|nr:hypothetical protein V496_00998 [Pseudogymnoascus sp. VKM F-4515 (FW-2607)]
MLTYITSSPSPSRTSFCKAPAELLESEQLLVDINAGTAEELINEQRAAAGLPPIGTITTLESIGELGGEAAEDAAEKMVKEAVEAVKNYGKEVVEAIGKANSSAAASTAAASNAANDEKLAGVITSDKEAAEAAKKAEFSAASAAISSQNFSTSIENMEKMIDEAAEAAKKARKPAEDSARERGDKILTKMGKAAEAMEKEAGGLKEEMSKTAAAAALPEFREKVGGAITTTVAGAPGSQSLLGFMEKLGEVAERDREISTLTELLAAVEA